jgi:hypothetical protein
MDFWLGFVLIYVNYYENRLYIWKIIWKGQVLEW